MSTTGEATGNSSKEKENDKEKEKEKEKENDRDKKVKKVKGNNKKNEKTELHYSMFKCFNRKFKINEVEPPFDVKESFAKYSDNGTHLSVNDFQRFLVDFQGESDITLSVAQTIIQQVLHRRHHVSQFARNSLSIDDLFHFLLFDDLNAPIKSRVHHDMTAPLSHYFIYTGHNSYLTGNQLSSDCSDIPIIKALQRGVRVIELDLWPNASKDDIQVLHGRTLTTPVSFSKCLKSIKEYAFVRSPYPLIITFEDHLTRDLQAKVAEITSQIFGDMLYYPQTERLTEFPSPESLMHRIIISTKPPKEYLESKSRKERDGKNSSDEETPGRDVYDFLDELEAAERGIEVDQDDEDSNISDCKSPQRGAPEYKRLITIHAGKPKGHLRDELKIINDQVRRLSLSEQGLEKAVTSYGQDTVRFTQKNILRIYPKGTRVTSSNFKPHIGWIHGAQMVAFNMQGYGKSLWLMHGMFRANGNCGYVKKPDFLMRSGPNKEVFDPKRTLVVKTRLKVRVYLGDGWRSDFSHTHFDTFSPPDFYTKLHIFGVPADAAKRRTKIIEDNWLPVWDEEFEFALTVPELALLLIEVREYDMSEKDDFGGQTCLPLSELRPGIRAVPLHDKKGDKLKSVKLLMRFQFVHER